MYPKENKQEKLIEATNSVEEKGLEINRHHFKDIDNVINIVCHCIRKDDIIRIFSAREADAEERILYYNAVGGVI